MSQNALFSYSQAAIDASVRKKNAIAAEVEIKRWNRLTVRKLSTSSGASSNHSTNHAADAASKALAAMLRDERSLG